MRTQCNPESMLFRTPRSPVCIWWRISVVARSTSDAGALLCWARPTRRSKAGRPVRRSALPTGGRRGASFTTSRTLGRPAGCSASPSGLRGSERPRRSCVAIPGARACSRRLEGAPRAAVRAAWPAKSTLKTGWSTPRSTANSAIRKIAHDPEAIRSPAVRRPVPGCPGQGGPARRIHARSGRHGRSDSTAHQEAASSTAFYDGYCPTCASTCSAGSSIYWRPKLRRSNIPMPAGRDRGDARIVTLIPRALAKGGASCCAPTAASPARR